jgi:nucleotide-binding universal stress UspA family protein
MTGAPVMVGVDGSPSSLEAVELAATEAALRGRRLHIVHAFVWPFALVAARPGSAGSTASWPGRSPLNWPPTAPAPFWWYEASRTRTLP